MTKLQNLEKEEIMAIIMQGRPSRDPGKAHRAAKGPPGHGTSAAGISRIWSLSVVFFLNLIFYFFAFFNEIHTLQTKEREKDTQEQKEKDKGFFFTAKLLPLGEEIQAVNNLNSLLRRLHLEVIYLGILLPLMRDPNPTALLLLACCDVADVKEALETGERKNNIKKEDENSIQCGQFSLKE